ncbi:lysozyme inhibitor LprI family protein [Ekhidna sp.]|uniref:lysozyme inhibitor LprI family protein n=1 Tax=Ekhidna sp. TaxID=2608089 RepID=UPI003C7CE066
MKKLAIIFFAGVILTSCTPKNDVDPCARFDTVDGEMLDLINQIRSKHKDNKKFLSNFNMEQVYWIQYRDHHLKSLYPKDWDRHYRKEYGKEVFNPCKCKEMTRFTEKRIEELKLWLGNGVSNQDECPSLWNE